MNARLAPRPPGATQWLPMGTADLDAVMAVETAAYTFPWSRGNFIDSLAAGYPAWTLRAAGTAELLGYLVGMHGVDELHLLNITVAPGWQGQGLALRMLDALVAHARVASARQVWLEVRESNERARVIYERYGFRRIGVRKGYYPALAGRREDALVMGLQIDALD